MNVRESSSDWHWELPSRLAGFPDHQVASFAQMANHVVQVTVCHVLGNAHGVIDVYFELLQTAWTWSGRRSLAGRDLAWLAASFASPQRTPLVALEIGQVLRDPLLVCLLSGMELEEFRQDEVIASRFKP